MPQMAGPVQACLRCLRPCGPADGPGDHLDVLEEAYVLRGRQLVWCELARRPGIETLLAERMAGDL